MGRTSAHAGVLPRFALIVSAALMLMATCASGAQALVVSDQVTHKQFGVVPAPGAAAQQAVAPPRLTAAASPFSCTTSCSTMSWHGGPVQHAENEYLFFWAPSGAPHQFPASYITGLQTWLNHVAAADYSAGNPFSVNQQYYDQSGSGGTNSYVPYAVQNAGTITDTDSYPSNGCTKAGFTVCLTDAQIEAEVSSYVSAHSLPKGPGTQYYVFTPQGVLSCFDGGASQCAYSSFCGYHSYSGSGSTQIVYADMPWAYQVSGCDVNSAFGAGYANADETDSVISVFSHELSETMTDPNLNAWFDSSGNEIGDKCAYMYGTGGYGSMSGLSQDSNGGYYNVTFGTDHYLMQLEYDQRSADCKVTDTDTQPSASLSAPGQAAAGSQISISLTGVSVPAGVAYVNWAFGDGVTSSANSTAAVTHTYNTAGSKTVSVIITDNHGNELQLSANVTVTSGNPPTVVSAPAISGTARQGQTLTESHASWSSQPTSYGYQWERCDTAGQSCQAIPGASSQTYALASADVGNTIVVQETATNVGGISSPSSSQATGVVAAALPSVPVNVTAPAISGTARQGQTLTEVQGSWTGSPTGYGYQWERCNTAGQGCQPISGASVTTYALTPDDVGHTIVVKETATNAGGSSNPASSQATGVVVAVAPVSSTAPTVSGTAQAGSTLTESHGFWSPAPTAYSYQWERCTLAGFCRAISGANSRTYVLGNDDIGSRVEVIEQGSTAGGTGAPATSLRTVVVMPNIAQLASALRHALMPSGSQAAERRHVIHIPSLPSGGYRFSFAAPSAGTLTIIWRHKTTTVAKAEVRAGAEGRVQGAVTLTPDGRRLLRGGRQVSVTAVGAFTVHGALPVSSSVQFTVSTARR